VVSRPAAKKNLGVIINTTLFGETFMINAKSAKSDIAYYLVFFIAKNAKRDYAAAWSPDLQQKTIF
jgi:hypothetical protein